MTTLRLPSLNPLNPGPRCRELLHRRNRIPLRRVNKPAAHRADPANNTRRCLLLSLTYIANSWREIKFSRYPRANPLPDHRPSSGPSINMISICVSERDEEAQENPPPFVINYAPEELMVGFTGQVASPAPFIVDVPAREPYSDSKVPWTYEGSIGSVEQQFSMNVDLNRVHPSKTAVRAFDGSRKEVNGEIDLLIDVGPCSFSITFKCSTSQMRSACCSGDLGSTRPAPSPHLCTNGGTLNSPSLNSDDTPATPSAVYAVTEEIPSGVHIRLAQENEELDNWTSVSRYSAVIADINVGTEEEPRTLKIGTALNPAQRARMIDFLKEYQEVFAWSYADMPGLDPSIVEHFLLLDTEKFPPKRQQLRRQRAGLLIRIKEEVVKQINAGFLEVCNYSEWVANIVPVEKKDERVRVCVDYRDLNKASPKDNFPLPHIDVLVDNTARHAQFSFMDGFSGYNQIRMVEKDKLKTTFTTMWGTFCYRVMPFGLKNAVATYQRAMVTLFHDMMHKEVELTEYDIEYVSPTSVKGQAIADHLAEFPIEDHTPINPDFPDDGILQIDDEGGKPGWKMYFDGAVNSTRSGIGAVLISPDGRYYPVATKIDFPCTNNVAEYEACILGLQAAIDFKVKELEVFGDSMLTIFQTLGQWKTKNAKLVPYHGYLEKLTENFENISFTYTPRMTNQFADALATLESMVSITKENLIEPLEIEIAEGPAHCNSIEASEAKPWYEDIKNLQTPRDTLLFERRDTLPPLLRLHTPPVHRRTRIPTWSRTSPGELSGHFHGKQRSQRSPSTSLRSPSTLRHPGNIEKTPVKVPRSSRANGLWPGKTGQRSPRGVRVTETDVKTHKEQSGTGGH
ncbi:hypothetical protein CRG98_016274 [Punica granatum]|uniref:RNase H type-1 domain-containing protein n=1 Tax=Punica granatum TaxID=22663 RepID=A0A2I0K5A5_PUNGR|nr:hypothetical protein CRG98_016274 [Punica granatum]